MKICIPRETHPGETRVPVVPATVKKLIGLGAQVLVESGLGRSCRFEDEAYQEAGARLVEDRTELLGQADMVLRLRKPTLEEVDALSPGTIQVSYLDPFNEQALLERLRERRISAFSLEMIPRTTIAQKMDVLSSQANLGGYVAVILAAEQLDRILPMMTTPAGTIRPARVFIIGVGVAGLQAIATARRLGARVEAFDTRPEVKEQVQSLGARFVEIDLGETGSTRDGYARSLTQEQLEKQKQGMARACELADVVITTAQVFGRPAPRIIDRPIIDRMQPGSVIVDMAVETGGNVEGSRVDEVVEIGGVRIIGFANLPGRVAVTASEMFSANLGNFVDHFWDRERKTFRLELENDLVQGALITHAGEIFSQTYKQIMSK
ncbi:Re/Si-specific NAD(P)(+) transhydrogenase subunit alpha [Desulfolithobacter sp.]